MVLRLLIIFSMALIGFLWVDTPEFSVVWSLVGLVVIACVSQTNWFMQSNENLPVTRRLLRPVSMYHFMFVGYYVLGGGAYALNAAGYGLGGGSDASQTPNFLSVAACQRLMLLSYASVTAGMKLAGFRYGPPKYKFASIPPYGFLVASMVSFALGTLFKVVPGLGQLSQRLFDLSATAILLEIFLCIKQRQYRALIPSLLLLIINVLQQALSGWKGLILFTAITLGALLYPLMPKRVLIGGATFVLFWVLYFYPFGLALRPLIWYEGVEQDKAIQLSLDEAINLSLEERLQLAWTLMVIRANDLYQFTKYVEYVPDNHPYYNFDILNNSMINLVPRLLWRGKPDMERLSMERVYEAGVVSNQAIVSAKSNFYQDAYLSWGEAGIVIACLSLGILIMQISRACERLFGGYDIGTCLIFTSLFATTINTPLNFEFFIGSICISGIVMFAMLFLGRITGWIIYAGELDGNSEIIYISGQRKEVTARRLVRL